MHHENAILSMRFPQKLWKIVNECKTGAICWNANGSTILLDYKKFQDEYLSANRPIFKTNNITSFIRQLNLYGFRKVTSHNRDLTCTILNPDVHEFLHEYFCAGRTDLLIKVCRKTNVRKKHYYHQILATKNDISQQKIDLQRDSISRLQKCRLELTNALKQRTLKHQRERLWDKMSIDDTLMLVKYSKEKAPNFYESNHYAIIDYVNKNEWFEYFDNTPSKSDQEKSNNRCPWYNQMLHTYMECINYLYQ